MAVFYYKGEQTDNPPANATALAMTADNLGPAMYAWLLLTTNPTWLTYFATAKPAPGMDIDELAGVLGITVGSLQFIFGLAKDSAVLGAMTTVANEFQSINQANLDGDAYHIPCPTYADMLTFIQAAKPALVGD